MSLSKKQTRIHLICKSVSLRYIFLSLGLSILSCLTRIIIVASEIKIQDYKLSGILK